MSKDMFAFSYKLLFKYDTMIKKFVLLFVTVFFIAISGYNKKKSIVGGQAINYLSQLDDNSFTLTWEPKGGSVAISGELGYTFGVYSLKPNNKDTVLYGTYVSVWKKQTDGNWKFVLQSQNEGIE